MGDYRFFPTADTRQDDIWNYTYDEWGEAQAKKYIRGLHKHLQQLSDKKTPWRSLPNSLLREADLYIDIYFSRYQRHYIFFRQLSKDTIGIMSLLHVSMQIPVRLAEDLEKIANPEK